MFGKIVPGLLDVLWPFWDGKHQTLHDKLVAVSSSTSEPDQLNGSDLAEPQR